MSQEAVNRQQIFRTISGTIGSDGIIKKGTGFKVVSHEYTGVYEIEFDKPFDMVMPDAFTVQAVSSNAATDIRFPHTGANALVYRGDESGMKYFTYVLEKYNMYMKDFEVRFSVRGMDQEE